MGSASLLYVPSEDIFLEREDRFEKFKPSKKKRVASNGQAPLYPFDFCAADVGGDLYLVCDQPNPES
jgi:hypothetical protein